MLNLRYKFYRNRRNARLGTMCDTAGYIWNHCVALCRRYYKMYGKTLNNNRLQSHIARLRKNNPYWKVLNSTTVQEICQRVGAAYDRFFKKKSKRPPKFKNPKRFTSFVFKHSGWSISGNKFTINKVGVFKFSYSRHYENIKRATIKRDAVGDFWLVLTCDTQPKPYDRTGNAAIGIDFGMKTYLTASNGSEHLSPEFYKEGNAKRKRLSRVLARKPKQRPSKNRTKAKTNLAKSHRDSTNKRDDHHWKLAHELCRANSFIALEDLNMEGMKRLWGRKISDLAFSAFVLRLEQVA